MFAVEHCFRIRVFIYRVLFHCLPEKNPCWYGQGQKINGQNGKNIFEGDFDNDGNCIVWCDNCNGFEFAQLDVPTKDVCIPCHRCDGKFFFSDHINDFEIVGNVAD